MAQTLRIKTAGGLTKMSLSPRIKKSDAPGEKAYLLGGTEIPQFPGPAQPAGVYAGRKRPARGLVSDADL